MHACLSIKKKNHAETVLYIKQSSEAYLDMTQELELSEKKKFKVTMIDILKVLIENV